MNIKFYTNLDNYRENIIDAFVEEYGEKWRETITKRYDEVEIYHFITLDGIYKIVEAEDKEIEKLKKKLKKNPKNTEEIINQINKKKKELNSLNNYLKAHANIRHHIFTKHINNFVENNKRFLTIEDQQIWNETKDINKLNNVNIILDYDEIEETFLDLYNPEPECLNYIDILKKGLLESFLFGQITEIENNNDNNFFKIIRKNQKQYQEIMGKKFIEMNISDEDLVSLNEQRYIMIENMLTEYQSHFLGYSYNLAKIKNRNSIFPESLTLNNQQILAYYLPSIIKKKNKFKYAPYISFSPTNENYSQNDHVFIHEITHAINTNPIKISNTMNVLCGFEQIKNNKKQINNETNENKQRNFEFLNEFLNDYIAAKVTKRLHNKDIYIWQYKKNKYVKEIDYQKFHFYVEPLYLKYKDELIEYFMTGNLEKIKQILPDDLEQMAMIANYISKESNKMYKTKKTPLEHYKNIQKCNNKIKRLVKKYHHDINLD